MSLPVHLADTLDGIAAGALVEVAGDEAHHAVAVRRLRVGASVVLTDGWGTAVTGVVESTGKRVFEVRVSSLRHEPLPSPEVVVVQALPTGDRGELAVEVLTEIGVARIVPWVAARSVAVWKGERAVCGGGLRARVDGGRGVAGRIRRSRGGPARGGLAAAGVRGGSGCGADRGCGRARGWSHRRRISVLSEVGGVAVRLGSEVVRTSTAGVAAVAVLLSRTSRWG